MVFINSSNARNYPPEKRVSCFIHSFVQYKYCYCPQFTPLFVGPQHLQAWLADANTIVSLDVVCLVNSVNCLFCIWSVHYNDTNAFYLTYFCVLAIQMNTQVPLDMTLFEFELPPYVIPIFYTSTLFPK